MLESKFSVGLKIGFVESWNRVEAMGVMETDKSLRDLVFSMVSICSMDFRDSML